MGKGCARRIVTTFSFGCIQIHLFRIMITLLFAFRYFFIIYFYICSVNTDCVKDMQTLLNDIELDIQELKCLMQAISSDANPTLKIVAKRNIQQMKARLEALQELLEEAPTAVVPPLEELPAVTTPLTGPASPVESVIPDTVKMVCEEPETVPILAERIKPAKDLKHAISLNDSFRFVRELFAGDAARMNEVVRRLGEAPSLDKAMDIFASEVHPDEENEAAVDFMELLKNISAKRPISMGKLYVVPTPVGNLEDMTFRAIRILKEVDLILAEDTRTSGILLKHFEIKNAMQSHHKFNEHKTVESVVNRIKGGETVALISDAGTPGISDPGFLVVRECVRNGIEVQCLPGATAFVPALVASGLPNEKFCFEGFLPQKKGRMTRLKALAEECRTMVFYESPHRLVKALTQFAEHFGAERQASVSREISKMHEETVRGTLTELIEHFTANEPRGEIVIVVTGIDD